ncbi:MAG TPA: response regulator transcription factor [Aggregatilinea sp.]|uniref:response regulator transcription factor n=1 Tax=Aggregatilinea sp. TaxID=2806333 RepID=UPI002BDC8E35|nr:response regulator transcription factor [Aggregatilinea sp.]HML20873.1 response regulator transcription factor [Aggregatilinea sp.]
MGSPIRIVLVDDHILVRSALRLLLEKEADIEVIGEAGDADGAVRLAVGLCPDVALMDISLGESNGVDATRRIVQQCPDIRIIALTMHPEDMYLMRFLEAGGVGYVRKSALDRDLISAIHAALRGDIFLKQEGIQVMARSHCASRLQLDEQSPGPDVLSLRERQVIELVAKGYTCREIGVQLSLSPRTVETYRERIMEKLNLEHRSELVEYALRHQLLRP